MNNTYMDNNTDLIYSLREGWRMGNLQQLGRLTIMGEQDWLAEGKRTFFKADSEHHMRVFDLWQHPKRMFKRFIDAPKNLWKGGAVYFLLDRTIDSIAHHSHILKIGETTRLNGRFDNYAMGHFYTGGVDTNLAVMNAMKGMNTDTCYVYYIKVSHRAETQDPLIGDTDWVPVTTKFYEDKYTDMFRELSGGSLPKGCKQ